MIYLISLTQDCMVYEYFGVVNYPSILALLFGGAHFIAGGILEGIIWSANPLYIIGIFLLSKKNDKSTYPLIISSLLSLTFLYFENLTMTRSG